MIILVTNKTLIFVSRTKIMTTDQILLPSAPTSPTWSSTLA